MHRGINLKIVVEGETEEQFVRKILAPKLGERMVFATAQRVETGRHKVRPVDQSNRDYMQIYRGGLRDYDKAKRDIQRWLRRREVSYVTSMIDYYGLPENFPAQETVSSALTPYNRVKTLEQAFANDLNDSRFIPYIQLHEFEALLFSNVNEIDAVLATTEESRLHRLSRIIQEFENKPEDIDDGRMTAPSKRLESIYPEYRKLMHGIQIIQRIDFNVLREACPHFNEWVVRLESLAIADQD